MMKSIFFAIGMFLLLESLGLICITNSTTTESLVRYENGMIYDKYITECDFTGDTIYNIQLGLVDNYGFYLKDIKVDKYDYAKFKFADSIIFNHQVYLRREGLN